MAPTTQKALVVKSERAPWELRTDWPVKSPGPKEVLIKLVSVALNPVDCMIQTYGAPFVTYPFLGGLDGSGIIEEVGAEVTHLAKGDKVLFPGLFEAIYATFQEYCLVCVENVAKIPDNITFDQAASVPLGLATVVCGLWSHHAQASSLDFPAPWEEGGATKFAGKPAVIVGGSGSVGQYAIQIARFSGFSPIIATSSLKHTEYLKTLGATHVLDRSLPAETLLAEIETLAAGVPVALVYDAIGDAETQRLGYMALGQGGGFVSVKPHLTKPIEDLIKPDDGKRVARPFASLQIPGNHDLGVEIYKRLTGWLADGTIMPNRIQVLPNGLAGIPDGLKMFAELKVSGQKLIVHPQETA